jgi:hypothetical protein
MFMPDGVSKGAVVVVLCEVVVVSLEDVLAPVGEVDGVAEVVVGRAVVRVVDGFSLSASTISGSTRALDAPTWLWNQT